ncbi:polysaccharide deacetylase family sporulation protein PdaB [Virgibacillus phasianinus]|uniref:Polysaccharide deacetylase family sporulation protein PdaB n=1 Tax=Virgibacillus phasianinus TaxID=2017483 RepID=A0A220U0G7_9BACI|nr:polysaccharide deacetylase family sporulation protein PdaB [Virgibacillus phasianinus]ASK61578.1 polysaccharide deacetylase family sporulation protein PdaB [Virgibacillus phasianinus]
MGYFYVWHFSRWKRFLYILLFALIAAVIIWSESTGSYSVFSTSDEPAAFVKGSSKEPNIALTFNISWGEEKVFDILKQLKEEDVQATFFVSGEWAERHPDILEKIKKNNHELGMLGYRYKSYLEQEMDQVKKDLLHAKEIFKKLGYENVTLMRAPSGHINKEIIKMAEGLGLKVVHWKVDADDWENPGTQKIVDTILKETSNGDVILLHASDSVKQTASALDQILPELKNKGFKFVPVSELYNQAHSKAELVK